MNVAEMLAALDGLPGDTPVVVMDDGEPREARWAAVCQWKRDPDGWGRLEYKPAPDDEPGDHEGFTSAVVLSAERWSP